MHFFESLCKIRFPKHRIGTKRFRVGAFAGDMLVQWKYDRQVSLAPTFSDTVDVPTERMVFQCFKWYLRCFTRYLPSHDWRIGKDLEWSGRGLIEVHSRHLSEGFEEIEKKTSVRIVGIPAEIRTEHPPNVSLVYGLLPQRARSCCSCCQAVCTPSRVLPESVIYYL
jgi:hypothetical protein